MAKTSTAIMKTTATTVPPTMAVVLIVKPSLLDDDAVVELVVKLVLPLSVQSSESVAAMDTGHLRSILRKT